MTLYMVSSNMPGYLPNDDNPFIGHGDAEQLVSVLADLIVRDGESSIESIMSDSPTLVYALAVEAPSAEEAIAGDAGMVELWQTGHEAYREAIQVVTDSLSHSEESLFGYTINWSDSPSGIHYFIQATDAELCSDETCDQCYWTKP